MNNMLGETWFLLDLNYIFFLFEQHKPWRVVSFQQSNIMQKQGTVQIWKKLRKVNIPKAPVSVLQMTTMTEHWGKETLSGPQSKGSIALGLWLRDREGISWEIKINFMLWINYTKLRAEDE